MDEEETKNQASSLSGQTEVEEKEQFETRWKCWQCKVIYQLEDICTKCKTALSELPADMDMNKILFEVKVSKV